MGDPRPQHFNSVESSAFVEIPYLVAFVDGELDTKPLKAALNKCRVISHKTSAKNLDLLLEDLLK